MKKSSFRSSIIAVLICIAACTMFLGCETAKGVGRDIMNADKWMRDNLW